MGRGQNPLSVASRECLSTRRCWLPAVALFALLRVAISVGTIGAVPVGRSAARSAEISDETAGLSLPREFKLKYCLPLVLELNVWEGFQIQPVKGVCPLDFFKWGSFPQNVTY